MTAPHSSAWAYDILPTPIGPTLAVVSGRGLRVLAVTDGDPQHELERVALELRALPDRAPAALDPLRRQLEEYFDGARTRFDIEIDWAGSTGVRRAALQAICDIPYGETAGYGEVAITAGAPRAARAVGTACATTPISVVVPVHRVIRADGTLGEYGGRPEVKRFLLDLEQTHRPIASEHAT